MSSHRKPGTSIGAGRRRSARSVERMPMSATSIVAIFEPSSIGEVRAGNHFANSATTASSCGLHADTTAPLVVLVIDKEMLDAPVVVENLEGGDEGFPT